MGRGQGGRVGEGDAVVARGGEDRGGRGEHASADDRDADVRDFAIAVGVVLAGNARCVAAAARETARRVVLRGRAAKAGAGDPGGGGESGVEDHLEPDIDARDGRARRVECDLVVRWFASEDRGDAWLVVRAQVGRRQVGVRAGAADAIGRERDQKLFAGKLRAVDGGAAVIAILVLVHPDGSHLRHSVLVDAQDRQAVLQAVVGIGGRGRPGADVPRDVANVAVPVRGEEDSHVPSGDREAVLLEVVGAGALEVDAKVGARLDRLLEAVEEGEGQ